MDGLSKAWKRENHNGGWAMDVKDVRVMRASSDRVYTIILDESPNMYGKVHVNIVDSSNRKEKNNIVTIETSDIILWAASL